MKYMENYGNVWNVTKISQNLIYTILETLFYLFWGGYKSRQLGANHPTHITHPSHSNLRLDFISGRGLNMVDPHIIVNPANALVWLSDGALQ